MPCVSRVVAGLALQREILSQLDDPDSALTREAKAAYDRYFADPAKAAAYDRCFGKVHRSKGNK